ncbi:methylaspartate mutase [Streptomyces griseus]|uniref:methylaspartate mutase n=1 Tax=Streptomyces griseus TaxID=1911 RepID=UPI0004CC6924|nr:methylaspartate mutase [Streptomyces griseus]
MFAGIETPRLRGLPDMDECVSYVKHLGKPTSARLIENAVHTGRPVLQPRCGVGGQKEMLRLLRTLEEQAAPEMLSLTIDSHTRLLRFTEASRILRSDPSRLNGYPLVSHGWRRGRELNESVRAPLEVRHGSPDARELFVTAIASGITAFEGGGVSYNLPYAKDVPLEHSLRAWQEVDRACGLLARRGVVVERELFGTLTAVLMPPSISIAVSLLEALAAADEGVTCLTVPYPQGGNAVQDVAALRAIAILGERHLGGRATAYPALHQFMGAFPRDPAQADALILLGGLVAVWGGAAKVVVKTNQEAFGIPNVAANVRGLGTTRVAVSGYLGGGFGVPEDAVAEETHWICREVEELVEPVLQGGDLLSGINEAFRAGRLDVPFSASVHAHNVVLPCRDPWGAIRFADPGRLPFSTETLHRNNRTIERRSPRTGASATDLVGAIQADIEYFSAGLRQPSRKEGNACSITCW